MKNCSWIFCHWNWRPSEQPEIWESVYNDVNSQKWKQNRNSHLHGARISENCPIFQIYINFSTLFPCRVHQSHSQQKRAASPMKPLLSITKPKTPPPLQKPKPAATLPQPVVRTRRLSVFHPKFQKAYANRSNNISPRAVTPSTPNQSIKCDVCHNLGTLNDVVRWVWKTCKRIVWAEQEKVKGKKTNFFLFRCDECKKNFHFHCLDPPVKKTPKRRGYSWHCANCDPTVEIFFFQLY